MLPPFAPPAQAPNEPVPEGEEAARHQSTVPVTYVGEPVPEEGPAPTETRPSPYPEDGVLGPHHLFTPFHVATY